LQVFDIPFFGRLFNLSVMQRFLGFQSATKVSRGTPSLKSNDFYKIVNQGNAVLKTEKYEKHFV
jgi:hypothetical protein